MFIKKTYNFLLLEIIIALLLISITIIPFSSYPYKVFKKEIVYLEKMCIEPYFSNTFAKVIQNLSEPISFTPTKIPFGKNSTLLIHRKAYILERYNKKTNNSLITIKVSIQSKHTSQSKEKKFFIKNRRNKNAI